MKAAVFQGVGKPLAIEERPDPSPGPGEAVIKATDKMCEIGLLPASTAPARASPAPWNQALNEARARARGGHCYL